MKKHITISALAAAAMAASFGLALAQSATGLNSLRGANVDEAKAPESVFRLDENRFTRNYRQQPPLVPHAIDQYQIDLRTNRCLSCHDWTTAGERKAPTLSMTHYLDRDGNQLDVVAGTRWFCNQCHVPQADAPELIDNVFEASN